MSVVFGHGGYVNGMVATTVRGLAYLEARDVVFDKIDLHAKANPIADTKALQAGELSVAEDFNRRFGHSGLQIAPEQVVLFKRCAFSVVTAVHFLQNMIKKEKPKVLLIKPTYSLFADTLEGLGFEVIYTDNFIEMSDTDRIANIYSKVRAANGIDLLVVNSPHNPTGEIYSLWLIKQINNLLADNPDMYALSDVVYERMTSPKNVVPTMFQLANESLRCRIVEVGGISKAFATGDRLAIGYAYSSAENAEQIRVLAQHQNIRIARIRALAAANSIPDSEREAYWHIQASRISELQGLLQSVGLNAKAPEATNFLLVDVPWMRGRDIVGEIFARTGVVMKSGEGFGSPANTLRLSAGSCIVLTEEFAGMHGFVPETEKICAKFSPDLSKRGGEISSDLRVLGVVIRAVGEMREQEPSPRCGSGQAEKDNVKGGHARE